MEFEGLAGWGAEKVFEESKRIGSLKSSASAPGSCTLRTKKGLQGRVLERQVTGRDQTVSREVGKL